MGSKDKFEGLHHLANVVIDRFGEDIRMIQDDERHFIVHTDIEVSPQFFGWLCGLVKGARLLPTIFVSTKVSSELKRKNFFAFLFLLNISHFYRLSAG